MFVTGPGVTVVRTLLAVVALVGVCSGLAACSTDDHVVLPRDVTAPVVTPTGEPKCSDVLASTTTVTTTTRPGVTSVTIVAVSGCRP